MQVERAPSRATRRRRGPRRRRKRARGRRPPERDEEDAGNCTAQTAPPLPQALEPGDAAGAQQRCPPTSARWPRYWVLSWEYLLWQGAGLQGRQGEGRGIFGVTSVHELHRLPGNRVLGRVAVLMATSC